MKNFNLFIIKNGDWGYEINLLTVTISDLFISL